MDFICRAAVACRCSCHGWKEQVYGRHRTVSPAAIFVTSHLARIAVIASEFMLRSYSQLLAGAEGTFAFIGRVNIIPITRLNSGVHKV
jgi:hypothetical protein